MICVLFPVTQKKSFLTIRDSYYPVRSSKHLQIVVHIPVFYYISNAKRERDWFFLWCRANVCVANSVPYQIFQDKTASGVSRASRRPQAWHTRERSAGRRSYNNRTRPSLEIASTSANSKPSVSRFLSTTSAFVARLSTSILPVEETCSLPRQAPTTLKKSAFEEVSRSQFRVDCTVCHL